MVEVRGACEQEAPVAPRRAVPGSAGIHTDDIEPPGGGRGGRLQPRGAQTDDDQVGLQKA